MPGCFLPGLHFVAAGEETGDNDDVLLGTSVFSLVGDGIDCVLWGNEEMLVGIPLFPSADVNADVGTEIAAGKFEDGGIPVGARTIESFLDVNFMLTGGVDLINPVCSQIVLLLIWVVESAAAGSPTIAMRSDTLWGKGSVSGILITLFGVVLSASLADATHGLRPEAVCAAATLAAASAILLDTNDSNVDCLLLSRSSISIGCSISNTPDAVESVTLVGFDGMAIEAVEIT